MDQAQLIPLDRIIRRTEPAPDTHGRWVIVAYDKPRRHRFTITTTPEAIADVFGCGCPPVLTEAEARKAHRRKWMREYMTLRRAEPRLARLRAGQWPIPGRKPNWEKASTP